MFGEAAHVARLEVQAAVAAAALQGTRQPCSQRCALGALQAARQLLLARGDERGARGLLQRGHRCIQAPLLLPLLLPLEMRSAGRVPYFHVPLVKQAALMGALLQQSAVGLLVPLRVLRGILAM